jgi:DNA-binding NarL/FixJ family response regulator
MGYVIKDRLMTDLSRALHEVAAGRRFVSASPNLQV